MDTFPTELLHRVLHLAVEEVSLPATFTHGSNPWTLSHVSSRFRSIALGSPRLWANVTITIDTGSKATQDSMRAIIQRARTFKHRLTIVWWRSTKPKEHADNPSFPTLDPSNPAAALAEMALLHCCKPFAYRISSLSMLFQNVEEFEFSRLRFHVLPREFFIGLSQIHLKFVCSPSNHSYVPVRPIFEERLFDTWTGVAAPKVTIQAWVDPPGKDGPVRDYSERARSRPHLSKLIWFQQTLLALSRGKDPLLINLSSPEISKIAHLALTGVGLLQTHVDIYMILLHLRHLQTLAAWTVSALDFEGAPHRNLRVPRGQTIHHAWIHTLDFTLCDTNSLPECLGGLLDFMITPNLTELTISRHAPSSARVPGGNIEVRSGILDSEGRVGQYLMRCEGLQRLNVHGFTATQEFEMIQHFLPSLEIARS